MIQWMWGYIKRIWSAVKAARKTSFRKRLVAMLAAIVLVVTTVGMVRPARTASSEDAAVQQTAGDTVQAEAGENADQTTGVVQTAAEENADTAAQTMPAGTFQAQTATSVQTGDDTAKSVVTNAEVNYDADTFQSGSSFSMKFIDKNSGDTTVSAQAESDQALIDEALASKGEQTAACYPYALTFLDADGNETEPAAAVNVKLTFAALPKTNANAQWAVFHITVVNGQYVAENLADSANEANRPLVAQNENGALTDVSFTAECFSDYVIAEVEAIPTATPVPTATPAPTATAVPTATPAPTATPTLTAAPTATTAPSAKEAESAATSPSDKSSETDSEAASSAKAGTDSTAAAAESSKTTVTPTASAKIVASSDAATATPTGSAKGAASSGTATATPTKSASSTDSSLTPTPAASTTSPARVMRRAAAAEKTQDITGNLTDASIKINGQEVTDSTWNVKADNSYDITLTFKENSSSQFPNDDTWMTYTVPSGITVEDLSTNFDMVVDGITISGNKLVVDKASGLIKLQWNTKDPNFSKLTDATNAYVNVNIKGSFDSSVKEITFSDLVKRDVDVDTKHNASIDKTGWYDSSDEKIHYIVTVTSSGTSKNVVVTDKINGTALTYDDNVAYTSTKGATATMTKKDNGFIATIPSMLDGEQVKFTYTASVDLDKLKESGTVEQAETANGVTITCPDDSNSDDNSKTQYVNDISFSSIGKNAQSVGDTYTDTENGKTYRDVTWNLTANNERKKHLTYISDSISKDSQGIMTYSGDGLTIVVTKEDGTQVTRTVKWTDSSSITKTDTGWKYTPPESDGKASYSVTYTTKADVTNLITGKNVSNNAKTDYNSTTGNATVGPTKENEFSASKEVTGISKEKMTWKITINVPAKGCDKLVVTDTLPSKWISGAYYQDSLDAIQSVNGLDNSESYTLDKQGTGSNNDPFRFILTFYKDKNKTQPGMNSSSGNRTITICYTTKNNETWMKDAVENPGNPDLLNHHNDAVVNASDVSMTISADANYKPSEQTVKKTGNWSGQYTDSKGAKWQVVAYDIILGGVTSDNQKITDTFDSQLKYFDGVYNQWSTDDSAGTIYGSDTNPYYPNEGKTKIPKEDIKCQEVEVDGGKDENGKDKKVKKGSVEFNIGEFPRKSDGTFYKAYRIHYFLMVKESDMKQLAIKSDNGTATFHNSVQWGTESAEADISYTYPGVSKECTIKNNVATYTIKINPEELKLNDGNPIKLVDTFTNQVIDLSTVKATDKNGKDITNKIHYDFSGNTGTFIIPDSTAVTITYQAKPSGKAGSTVNMTNKAEMTVFKSETSKQVEIKGSASGGASTVSLRLMKYAKGNMLTKLSGAVFQLFDADGNALQYDIGDKKGQNITFTTGSDGYVDIKLSSSTEYTKGLEEDKTYKLKEIQAPDGYQLADGYIPFTISKDGSTGTDLYANGDTLPVADKKITNVKVTLKKVDSGNLAKTLSGAVFNLYGSDYVGSDGNVNTSAKAISTNLTTGTDGTVALGTRTNGTYYLVETKAPSGYVAEEKPIKLTVTDEQVAVVQGTDTRASDIKDDDSGQTATVTVTDSAGYVLPSTGGIGTVPFYVIGGILAIGAVVALVVRAKMKDR